MSNPLEDSNTGEQKVPQYFDGAKASGPGRPTLSDDDLIDLRNGLYWLLSVKWPDIGWELPRVETPEQLRNALAPIKGHPYEHLVTRFLHATPVPSSPEEIRALRKNRSAAIENLREAQSELDRRAQEARTAELAMNEAQVDTQQSFFLNLLKRWGEFRRAQSSLDTAQAVLKAIERDVADQEAGFCQSELVEFIFKANYARNPLGLSNAMAGLPDVAWETSRGRCSKYKPEPNFHYRLFLTISAIWRSRENYPELPTVELFRQEILKMPVTKLVRISGLLAKEKGNDRIKLPNNLRSHLVENWPYLKSAVEETDLVRVHPKQIPFLIAAAFSRNLEKPRTPQDQVRADRDKIE
jgi:hypothetical protein